MNYHKKKRFSPGFLIPAAGTLSVLTFLTASKVCAGGGTEVCTSGASGRIVTHGTVIYDSADIRNLAEAVESQANEIISFREGLLNGVQNIGLEPDGSAAPYKNTDSLDPSCSASELCAAIRGSQAIRDENRTVTGSRYIHGRYSDTDGLTYDNSMVSEDAEPWTTTVYKASADDLPLGAAAYIDGEYLVGTGMALDAAYATGLGSVTEMFKNISVDPDGGSFVYPLTEGSSATESSLGVRTFYAAHDFEDIGTGFTLEKKNYDTGTGYARDYIQKGWKISSEGSTDTGSLVFTPVWDDVNYTLTIRIGSSERQLSLCYGDECDLREETSWIAGTTDDTEGKRTIRGWIVSSGDAALSSDGVTLTMGKGSSVVEATWDDWSTLSIDMGGRGTYNGSAVSGASYKWGTTLSLGVPDPVSGYSFEGWSVKDDSGNTCTADSTGMFTMPGCFLDHSGVTATALWKARTYTVRFNSNGGSGIMSDQTFTIGTTQQLKGNTFARTGCSFAGWAMSDSGEVVYGEKESVTDLSEVGGAVINLYAKWKYNTYKLTLKGDSGFASADLSWKANKTDPTVTDIPEDCSLTGTLQADLVPYGAQITLLPNLMVDNSAEYVLNTIDGYSGEEKEAGYTFTMPASEKSISVTTRRYAFEEGKTYFRYKLRGEDYAKWNYSGCLCLWKDYNASQTSKKTTVVTGGDDTSWYFLSCADDNGPVVPGDVCTFGGTGRLTAYYGGSDADNYLSNEFLLAMSPKLKDILANTPFAVYKAAIPETGAQDSVPKATIDSGLYGQDDTILSDSSSGTTSYTGVYTRKVFLPSYIEINTYSPEKLTGLRSVWENEESGPRKGWWTRVVTKDLYTNAWNRLCTGVWAYNLKTSFTQIGLRPAFCIPNG